MPTISFHEMIVNSFVTVTQLAFSSISLLEFSVVSKNPCQNGSPLMDDSNEPFVCGGETQCPDKYWLLLHANILRIL